MTKIKFTLTNMRRSPYQSLAAITMTMITFFVITIFALIILGASGLLTYFESRPQVTAFFKDTATPTHISDLRTKVEDTGVVDQVKYISKEDALVIYRQQNEDNPLLLEMVTSDILPASLEVSAKSVGGLDQVAVIMKEDKNVEEVVYQKDVIDTLKKWVDGVRLAGLSISGILILTSLLTIIIILGMRVSTRRTEIKTLSLLGATSWYIRTPFLLEGLIYAESGVILGWGVGYLLLLYLTPNLLDFFVGIPLFPIAPTFMLILLGAELLVGSILGLIASGSATRRYWK